MTASLRAAALRLHGTPRADAEECRRFLQGLSETAEHHAAAAIAGARLSAALREQGELAAAFAAGLESRRRAEAGEDPVATAMAWTTLGQVLYTVGQLTESPQWLERAVAVADLPAEVAVRARMSAAAVLRAQRRLPEAEAVFDAMTGALDAVTPDLAASVLINAASCWHQVGRIEDARAALGQAAAALHLAPRPALQSWHYAIAAWVEEAAGDGEAALVAARIALNPSAQSTFEVRSSAVRAIVPTALRGGAAIRAEVLEHLRSAIDAAEKAGARRQAVDLHLAAAQVCEEEDDLLAAVEHLRSARAIEELLAGDEERLRNEKEQLRLELARMQVEADTMRAHTEALARANRALAAADGARARLMQMLAHDLRNPLLSVFGAVDLMDPSDPADVVAQRAHIVAAAARMAEILEAALSPRQEGGWPPVDAAEVARQCAASFSGLAARKGQSLLVSYDGDTILPTDREALSRILDNLVSNALKFSGADTQVDIVVAGSTSRVDVSVLDKGPGLPEVDADDGLMLGSTLITKATGGEASWGIGLHTVYELAAELGGILSLGNRPGGGAAIRVSLPRRFSPPRPAS